MPSVCKYVIILCNALIFHNIFLGKNSQFFGRKYNVNTEAILLNACSALRLSTETARKKNEPWRTSSFLFINQGKIFVSQLNCTAWAFSLRLCDPLFLALQFFCDFVSTFFDDHFFVMIAKEPFITLWHTYVQLTLSHQSLQLYIRGLRFFSINVQQGLIHDFFKRK